MGEYGTEGAESAASGIANVADALLELDVLGGSLASTLERLVAPPEMPDVDAGVVIQVRDVQSGLLRTIAGRDDDEFVAVGGPGTAICAAVEEGRPVFAAAVSEEQGADLGLAPGGAAAVVPIQNGGRPIGVLVARRRDPDPFTAEDRSLFSGLSRRLALVIEREAQLTDARHARERAEALAWVANALIAAGDLSEVLTAVVEGAAAALSAQRGTLATLDAEGGGILEYVESGLGETLTAPPKYEDLMEGLPGWVFRNARPARTDHRGGYPDRGAGSPGSNVPMAAAPVRFGDEVLGVLSVWRGEGEAPFIDVELDLIIAMAGQAAVAIENVRLIESTRARLKETQALFGVSQAITTAQNVAEVVVAVVDGAVTAVAALGAAAYVVDEAKASVTHHAGRGLAEAQGPAPGDDMTSDAVGRVLAEGAPVGEVVPGGQFVVAAPMRSHDRLVGVLRAQGPIDGTSLGHRLELLMTLAAHAGAAIDGARLLDEVQRRAVTDELTGLANRRHLFELAGHEFVQATRYHRALSAIMIDLDHFKEINDRFGHGVGDEVLRSVAAHCAGVLRKGDVIGRYGGEEFAVLLPESDAKAATAVADRMRERVAENPVDTSHGPVQVTISGGVAELDPSMADVHDLIDRADAAMYLAKRTGRNRIERV